MERYYDEERPNRYSYKSVNASIVDARFMGPFCRRIIRLVPASIPANAITLMGSASCAMAFLILSGLLLGPMSSYAPRHPWIFGVAALLVFLYQVADSLDGLQARRRGCSGPLGEFLDHWLDSINAFLLPLGIAIAFPAIPPAIAASGVLVFAVADWLTGRSILEKGVMELGPIGGEEGLTLIYLFLLSFWALGYDFWASSSLVLGFPPIWIVYSIVPLAYCFIALSELEHAAGAKAEFAILVATLLPMLVWTSMDLRRDGPVALLVGGLAIGGAGTRFAGDVLRDRLLGLRYEALFIPYAVADAFLLASVLAPGLPAWAPMAAGVSSLLVIAWSLASQLERTVARVREVTGRGLFD
jgi:phosphatidylglycerophosphate synthase